VKDAGAKRLQNIYRHFSRLVAATVLLLALPLANAHAISFIRDAEIEHNIRTIGAPLFAMAGLEPASVHVYIVNEPSLNAFVAGGQNIFIHTGLLMAADTPNQLIGVIAHETGHISGGHLARLQEAMRGASAQNILAMVLGTAAAVAGGGGAGQAIMGGGAQITQRTLLKYSRIQEASADQAAFDYLDRTGQSSRGLLEFFEKLGDQEALLTSNQDPYVRTHPLTRDRVDSVRAHVETSPYADVPDPPQLVAAHLRMQAKLYGYLRSAAQTYKRYPESDNSIPARYARAIALHRTQRTEESIAVIDTMLADLPDDPFLYELKGQFLFESGQPDAAIAPYTRSVELMPYEPLLRVGLAQAQVSARDDAHIDDAVINLRQAARQDPTDPSIWRWLAMAYGRKDDIPMATLATAERYMLIGRTRDAMIQAARAEEMLTPGTPSHLHALDIRNAAEARLRDKN